MSQRLVCNGAWSVVCVCVCVCVCVVGVCVAQAHMWCRSPLVVLLWIDVHRTLLCAHTDRDLKPRKPAHVRLPPPPSAIARDEGALPDNSRPQRQSPQEQWLYQSVCPCRTFQDTAVVHTVVSAHTCTSADTRTTLPHKNVPLWLDVGHPWCGVLSHGVLHAASMLRCCRVVMLCQAQLPSVSIANLPSQFVNTITSLARGVLLAMLRCSCGDAVGLEGFQLLATLFQRFDGAAELVRLSPPLAAQLRDRAFASRSTCGVVVASALRVRVVV